MLELLIITLLCGAGAFALGVMHILRGEERKATLALLTNLASAFGGEIGKKPHLQLEGVALDGADATLRVWRERDGMSDIIVRWRLEATSQAFAPVRLTIVHDDHTRRSIARTKGLTHIRYKSVHHSSLFCFQADGASIEMRWLDLFAWLFVEQHAGALAWEDRFPNGSALLCYFAISNQRFIMEGYLSCEREDLPARYDYLEGQFELHYGLIEALHEALSDFSLVPFLNERIDVLAEREAFVPLHDCCKALFEREDKEARQRLTARLLEELHPMIGFGVLELEQWEDAFEEMTDEHLLWALSAIIEARFEHTRDEHPNISFQPDEKLQRAFREEGVKRFAFNFMVIFACEHPEKAHGFFELFTLWREEGVSEDELCTALLVLFPLLSPEQIRFALLALRNGHPVYSISEEEVAHPSHADVLVAAPFEEFHLRTYFLLCDHATLLAEMDPELILTPAMLEMLVRLMLLYPYTDKPGGAYKLLLEHGDERLLPLLKPHVETNPRFRTLFLHLAGADRLDGMSGMISVAADPEQTGALTISNLAGDGALSSMESEDETSG